MSSAWFLLLFVCMIAASMHTNSNQPMLMTFDNNTQPWQV